MNGKMRHAIMIKSEIGKLAFTVYTIAAKMIENSQEPPPNNVAKRYFSFTYIFRVIGNVNKKG